MPYLYIISGCNGAGKTTASFTILPEMLKCKEFVNSDEIAKGLSPFNSDSIAVAVEASRIMYKRIKELIASGETFAMGNYTGHPFRRKPDSGGTKGRVLCDIVIFLAEHTGSGSGASKNESGRRRT